MRRKSGERDRYKLRLIALVLFLLALAGALVYRSSVLMFGQENKDKINLVLMNREPKSLQKLNDHAGKLEAMTTNIEEYSFFDIRTAIQETTNLVTLTNRELEAQYDAWVDIQDRIKNDSGSYYKLRNQLNDIQNLQDRQILELKKMLEQAEKPSIVDDFISLSLTFMLGILSSLLASAGRSEWKRRRSV